jgi:histidyl-tRNA synthetase
VRETLTSRADLRENLCEDCVKRLGANVLRVFDCKNEVCRAALKQLIPIGESVCEKDKDDFSAFQRILSEFRVDFRADSSLVRGLDYYTGIVYEVYIKGRSDAVAGGGRYDNLIQVMGGPPTPAAGFAIGVDRIADFVSARGQGSEKTRVFLVSLGREALAKNFRLLSLLRQKGIAAQMEYSDKSPKAQFRRANSCGAAFTVIRGDEEIQKSIVKLKDMSDGSEKELKEEDVCSVLQKP